jgi:RNA polymerase sporulation-specific sigma factor
VPDYRLAAPLYPQDHNTNELYAEFQPLVRRLIRQYGGSAEGRQELQGEIYYRFVKLVNAYDPDRGVPLRPYLVRQLTASIYTHARQCWRRARRETTLDWETVALTYDPTPDWDKRLEVDQVIGQLPRAIARLPKRQRQVVIWRYFDNRSFEEISTVLNVQVSTARSLLRHGLENLRRQTACQN